MTTPEQYTTLVGKFGVTLVHQKAMSSHRPTVKELHFTLRIQVPEGIPEEEVLEVLAHLLNEYNQPFILGRALFLTKSEDDVVH